MVKLTFIAPDGHPTEIEAPTGANLMEVSVAGNIEGILADCGGNMVCGTCHVIIPERFHALLPEPSTMEQDILECVPDPQPYARLCCQIQLTDALDGLVLHVPTAQH